MKTIEPQIAIVNVFDVSKKEGLQEVVLRLDDYEYPLTRPFRMVDKNFGIVAMIEHVDDTNPHIILCRDCLAFKIEYGKEAAIKELAIHIMQEHPEMVDTMICKWHHR